MEHMIKHGKHTIEITTEHSSSSYGIPVLVVDGEVVMQIPLTKEEREQHKEMIRAHVMGIATKQ
jgi:hypothetical protein